MEKDATTYKNANASPNSHTCPEGIILVMRLRLLFVFYINCFISRQVFKKIGLKKLSSKTKSQIVRQERREGNRDIVDLNSPAAGIAEDNENLPMNLDDAAEEYQRQLLFYDQQLQMMQQQQLYAAAHSTVMAEQVMNCCIYDQLQ